jgi:hypothetical protein
MQDDNDNEDCESNISNDDNDATKQLKILTFNIMFDGYEDFISGVIHSKLRHTFIIEMLKKQNLNVICFNEVTVLCGFQIVVEITIKYIVYIKVDTKFLKMLCEDEYIKKNFALSDVVHVHDDDNDNDNDDNNEKERQFIAPQSTFARHGVVVLVKRDLQVLSMHLLRSFIPRVIVYFCWIRFVSHI